MWYHYQIINRLSGVIKAESYEQHEDKQEVDKIGKIALNNLKLNGAIYVVKVVPVKENFLPSLRRELFEFDVHIASQLILKIAAYKHAGGATDSEEDKLLSLLETKIIEYENHSYGAQDH